MAGFQVYLNVREYHADVYYNTKTGKRVHAAFPAGVVDEVNYDGSIRAFLFIEELIREAGMELLAVYDAYTGKAASEESERLFFIAREKGKAK